MSDKPTKPSPLRIRRIIDIVNETPTVKTIEFMDRDIARSKPGQFLMTWIPCVDEIPMSISSKSNSGICAITVKKVGEATSRLHEMQRGDRIGIRGPYGNGFKIQDGPSILVGGGTGLAPLTVLAEELVQKQQKTTFVAGAKTGEELLFQERLKELSSKNNNFDLQFATDDGTTGEKCLASDLAAKILREKKNAIKNVYACGPEMMMVKIFHEAEKLGIEMQASLERYMKCGIGLCGQCVLDPIGALVCHDGPVFSNKEMRRINDLGRYKREANGGRMSIT